MSERYDPSGTAAEQINRIALVLSGLDAASRPGDRGRGRRRVVGRIAETHPDEGPVNCALDRPGRAPPGQSRSSRPATEYSRASSLSLSHVASSTAMPSVPRRAARMLSSSPG